MIKRNVTDLLLKWKNKKNRKPLIIRGARQIGKTYAIEKFGKANFDKFIYLNLERPEDAELFEKKMPLLKIVELIELKRKCVLKANKVLLFIDEIQTSSEAMKQLRYFYEDYPDLHVIAAGSLLEIKMKQEGFSFPVGRVEYCYMYPVTFDEYLRKIDCFLLDKIKSFDMATVISDVMHKMCLEKYYEYLAVGGMPEAVSTFAATKSFIEIDQVYDSIFTGFLDDVYKYSSEAKAKYIQHVLNHSPESAGKIVKYEHFGGSNYKSREMRDAINVLEQAMILNNIKASISLQAPILTNLKKGKKLIFLDSGLINYKLGLREEVLTNINQLESIYRGQLAEQTVGQALLTIFKHDRIAYWYRNKKGATSEIDFLIQKESSLIPVEVKSGKTGSLKSLHIFMRESNTKFGIRIYSGPFKVEKITINNTKAYTLLSLPFYLIFRIEDYIDTFKEFA